VAKKKNAAPRETLEELERAFTSEGITLVDLVRTVNEARTGASRFSPKTGEELGPDHATRERAAEFLFELKFSCAPGDPPAAQRLIEAAREAELPVDPLA
jgi:hypothetical protein